MLADGRQLILASTSPFRREILQKLQLPFRAEAPHTDETPHHNEAATALVQRLAVAKAASIQIPNSLVIGSDQVAALDGQIIGKPANHEAAYRQLAAASGRRVRFHTGLCLRDHSSGRQHVRDCTFDVVFRELSAATIEDYLQREQPYNCAGSFRSEALGIALFARMDGDDPNALVGLPLIALIDMLAAEGVHVLGAD